MSEEIESVDSSLYLTFRLEKELLALDVSRVREVLDVCAITRVPRTPEYMRGVINLRGTVIPVIDLRSKFGMSKTESTIDARIIVLEIRLDGMETIVGVLTDSVHEVIDIFDDQIDPPPETGTRWRREFIRGIGKHNNNFILLLDIDRVFTTSEMSSVIENQAEATV